ncbi:MAG: GNAT family N-acetyltransferase [Candidatus Cloacimonetes bacterium]|nr:GNAT family N-acetyltransferase [Candidatus Cloacimonadota bacterium]
MRYQYDLNNVTANDLQGFFEGWENPPSTQKHYEILKNSSQIILAYENDKLIGFITAITDNVISAYIPLLEILPEYKNQGIGSELLHRMLEQLNDVYMIDIVCDEQLAGFYEKQGFSKLTGMAKRNRGKQSCES